MRALALFLAAFAATPVAPQILPPAPVIVADVQEAIRSSAAALALREIEIAERRALQARFDAEQRRLEQREAELVELRDTLERTEFEVLTTAFDDEVRSIRQKAQEDAAALQARFAAAQRALLDAARPIAATLMRERGAIAMIDRKLALVFDPEFDVTDALVERLNAANPTAAGLLPPP